MAVTELPNALDRNTHIYIYIYIFSVQDNEIVTEIGGAVWIFFWDRVGRRFVSYLGAGCNEESFVGFSVSAGSVFSNTDNRDRWDGGQRVVARCVARHCWDRRRGLQNKT